MPLTDITFDLTQTTLKATSAGCTCTIQKGLMEEAFVKFCEAFVKNVINIPLSSNLQVSSHKALEMENKDDFFHTILGFKHAS